MYNLLDSFKVGDVWHSRDGGEFILFGTEAMLIFDSDPFDYTVLFPYFDSDLAARNRNDWRFFRSKY